MDGSGCDQNGGPAAAAPGVRLNPPVVSVVIPAYNEERRLPDTLMKINAHLAGAGLTYEIVVVDDGSTDATCQVVEQAHALDTCVRLVATPHAGKGSAVRAGVAAALGSRIVFCDADLPVAPQDVERLAHELDDCDVAIATREGPGAQRVGEPIHRHLMGRVFNLLTRIMAVPGIHDTQCGLKSFRAESAARIFPLQTIEGFGFDVEVLFIAKHLGYRIREVPVLWSHRPSSRVDPLRDTVRMFTDLVRIRARVWRGNYGRVIEARQALPAQP